MRSIALHQAQTMSLGQGKQALDAQAELNGGIGEVVLAATPTTGRCVPPQVFVQPKRQRPSGFESGVVLGPVCGLVTALRALEFSDGPRLSGRRAAACTAKTHQNLSNGARTFELQFPRMRHCESLFA